MISVEIVSDFVCPWCFIGTRRLATALAQWRRDEPAGVCAIRWRPFFLNPETPPEGEPYLPFLERKFGDRASVEALFARVRAAGRVYGLDYAFEKIRLRANTLRAHRLVHWAQQQGEATALVDRLFVAQFQRGEAIGEIALLAQIAGECGYDAAAAQSYLESAADVDAVRAQEREARQRGIDRVPSFIIDGSEIVVGAEDPALPTATIRRRQRRTPTWA
jgi:predicted DsbA family dithiol-disulfide isomerase